MEFVLLFLVLCAAACLVYASMQASSYTTSATYQSVVSRGMHTLANLCLPATTPAAVGPLFATHCTTKPRTSTPTSTACPSSGHPEVAEACDIDFKLGLKVNLPQDHQVDNNIPSLGAQSACWESAYGDGTPSVLSQCRSPTKTRSRFAFANGGPARSPPHLTGATSMYNADVWARRPNRLNEANGEYDAEAWARTLHHLKGASSKYNGDVWERAVQRLTGATNEEQRLTGATNEYNGDVWAYIHSLDVSGAEDVIDACYLPGKVA